MEGIGTHNFSFPFFSFQAPSIKHDSILVLGANLFVVQGVMTPSFFWKVS